MSSTFGDHVDSTPSTSNSEIHGQKGKVKVPGRLCEGDHTLHHCPFLDEAKRVLDNHPTSPQQLPSGYRKLSPSPLLVENFTNITQLSIETPLTESEYFESIPHQSQQVEVTIDPVLPSEDHAFHEESKNNTIQILFVTSESDELGGNPPIPSQQEENSPVPATQGVNSTVYSVPTPSSLVTSFDWNRLARSCLPSYVPF